MIFFYNILHGLAPKYLFDIFPVSKNQHYSTRNQKNLELSEFFTRTKSFSNSFFTYCIKEWNKSFFNPEKVIFNISKATLNESKKALLSEGLNFSLPPKQVKYADYLLNFELFFRDIFKLDILSNKNLDFFE